MSQIRGIKVMLDIDKRPYAGTTKTAVLDFCPAEVTDADGWGCAPSEAQVRPIFRALVDASAVDGPENWAQARIVSCTPDPDSPQIYRATKGKADDGSNEPVINQASRWTVVSHTPYCG